MLSNVVGKPKHGNQGQADPEIIKFNFLESSLVRGSLKAREEP